jgi:hypothetical protein
MAVNLVMPSVFRRIIVALMVGGALWVTVVAIRIETQNAAAGYYLPRRDEPGKWRISREDLPRDQLRKLVSTLGVWQYIFSPLVIALASICFIRRSVSWQRWVGVASGVVGLGALSLALYRGYFSSLGL